MEKLKVKTTILPTESFSSPEEWLQAIGAKPVYRQDGTSIAAQVSLEDTISYVRRLKGIPSFTQKTWADFVSHKFSIN